MKNDSEYLNNLRHSCAHLLAAAVMQLWPKAKRTIGPAIENGFYFDFDFGKVKISEDDLPKIEAKMQEILPAWKSFDRHGLSAADAKKEYPDNEFKHELIDEFSGKGKKKISFYKSGDYWDLCRGGHVEHPDQELKHFKLLSVAGAYWRGDEKNKMLTRIYGTCFPTKEELDQYLWQQAEAKKRDHRKLGKELELFLISPNVGSGLPIYMPKGLILRRILEIWLTGEKEKRGYQFVWTPHIAKSELYKQSKHWQKYDAMMKPMEIEGEQYVVKPMNCPHHFQIYLERPRSYRDLPLRIAENATVYRYEKAGELNGLLRVRAVTQDDTHTFVRHKQIPEEIDRILELTTFVFKTFGFTDYRARISTRDPKQPDKYLGKPSSWESAEKALMEAVKRHKMPFVVGVGEAAFYGPKIDVLLNDAIGREWQLTTVQLDFNQPENFDLQYVNEEGKFERPAVLHIAILGAFDRFMAILIEHYAGAFPLWLAPVQVALIPIAERHNAAVGEVAEKLKNAGIRVEVDDRNETMQAKIRDSSLQKVPYLGIIGDKEVENKTISLRSRVGKDLKGISVEDLVRKLTDEIESKS